MQYGIYLMIWGAMSLVVSLISIIIPLHVIVQIILSFVLTFFLFKVDVTTVDGDLKIKIGYRL